MNAPKASGAGCSADKSSGPYARLLLEEGCARRSTVAPRAPATGNAEPNGTRSEGPLVPGICLIGDELRRASDQTIMASVSLGSSGLRPALKGSRAQGVVVVVEQEQAPILQREDALDGLEGEREQVPEADAAFSFELRDPVRVPDREQVYHLSFDQEPFGVGAAQVYEVDLLEVCLRASRRIEGIIWKNACLPYRRLLSALPGVLRVAAEYCDDERTADERLVRFH